MSKTKKHLDFFINNTQEVHINHPESGRMIYEGLCVVAMVEWIDEDLLDLFEPTEQDDKWLEWEGHSRAYWGSGSADMGWYQFTPLRQTIVLFMAAMNGEL